MIKKAFQTIAAFLGTTVAGWFGVGGSEPATTYAAAHPPVERQAPEVPQLAPIVMQDPGAGVAANAAPKLDAAMKQATIDMLIKQMNDRYVDAKLAKEVERVLSIKLRDGEFNSIDHGFAFAEALSKTVNEICKDAHLRIRYSATPLPERKDRNEPSAEEMKAFQKYIRLNNAGYDKVERLAGNVGYLEVRMFAEQKEALRQAEAAMKFLADTDAMILDLRRNGGGSPDGVQLLCSYFFDEKPVHLNSLLFRDKDKVRTEEFWTLKKVAGPRYVGKDLFVLVGPRTGSGAEECAYNLQQLKRGTIFGEKTWGGANPGGTVRLNDHFSAFIPVGRAQNPYTKTNWEGVGVVPDVKIEQAKALKEAHIAAIRALLGKTKEKDDIDRLQQALSSVEATP